MPHVIIIAGPNGSGKSTTAPALLEDKVHIRDFVNADVIAQGLSAFQPEKEAMNAGRIMLKRLKWLANEGRDFAFETTLATRTFVPWLLVLKQRNCFFHLNFLYLDSADIAVERVKERFKLGGHFVPEETVRRRYNAGLENFFNLYIPVAESWQFYDNSKKSLPLIAEKSDNIKIHNKELWKNITGKYEQK